MKITMEADYAIRIAYILMQRGQTTSARYIAEQSGVTLRFTLKILRKLAQSGIVQSFKGSSGGYRLAVPPEELEFGRLIECIDGPVAINHCLTGSFNCTRVKDEASCRFRNIFSGVSAKLRDELYSVKMSDFMRQ